MEFISASTFSISRTLTIWQELTDERWRNLFCLAVGSIKFTCGLIVACQHYSAHRNVTQTDSCTWTCRVLNEAVSPLMWTDILISAIFSSFGLLIVLITKRNNRCREILDVSVGAILPTRVTGSEVRVPRFRWSDLIPAGKITMDLQYCRPGDVSRLFQYWKWYSIQHRSPRDAEWSTSTCSFPARFCIFKGIILLFSCYMWR